MAKVKFGAIITDSRGSIGGHTLKWSRWGNVLGNKPQPHRAPSSRQRTTRANFATLSKRWWSVLTPTQRTAWRDLAAANPRPNHWGDEYPLTGLAFYIGINQRLRAAELAQTDTAPADQVVTAPLTLAIDCTAPAELEITYTATPVPADHIAYLFVSSALSPGRTNFDGAFFFLGASAPGQTSPWSVGSDYVARFGDLIAGRQYAAQLSFLNSDNGALSTFLEAAAIAI